MRAVATVASSALLVLLGAACAASGPSPTPTRAPPPATKLASAADAAASAASCAPIDLVGKPGDPVDDTFRIARPADPKATCDIADSNLASAEAAILGGGAKAAPVATAAWDRRTPPRYLDRVDARFRLTPAERALLQKNGFVVLPRLESTNYTWGLHEVYQSELPIFVSLDAVFHAVYASNDGLLATVERVRLRPVLAQTLDALACALPSAVADYPPDVAHDLDVYLTVARSLLASEPVPSELGNDDEVARLVEKATKAEKMETVDLFGRPRVVDFTAYALRGHYTDDDTHELASYFRAATWLSRLELNLVSRSCRSSAPDTVDARETPREDVDALALADLADRGGTMPAITALDRAWALFAGKREDVSIADLSRLRAKAHITKLAIPEAADAFRAAIGSDFQRTARLHYMPEGSTVLPAIATMLGPRVVPDTAATRPLVHGEVEDRHMVHAADMAYALGHDRAKAYLAADLGRFPALGAKLETARGIVQAPLPSHDLYSTWFGAIRATGKLPEGTLPSFMRTDAYADLRVDTAVASFGQIRHNYVLMAGQGYDEGGCEIPDGYVEPAPAAYAALVDYAQRGKATMAELDPNDAAHARAYFEALERTLRVLATIGDDELAGRPLSDDEKRFLSMVVEMTPAGTGQSPTYTGFYLDLFRDRIADGLADSGFIADYFTSGWDEKIAYVGAAQPRMGIFVVDTGGPPRVVVGPVARAYEHVGPLAKRLSDDDAKTLDDRVDPWAKSYTAPDVPAPPLAVRVSAVTWQPVAGSNKQRPTIALEAMSTRPLGPVTIELVDHHRVRVAADTHAVGTARVTFRMTLPPVDREQGEDVAAETIRVRVGEATIVADHGIGWPEYFAWGTGGMPQLDPPQ